MKLLQKHKAVENSLGSDGNFLTESPFSRQNVLKAYPKEEARQDIMKATVYLNKHGQLNKTLSHKVSSQH